MVEGSDLLHKGVVMIHDDHTGYATHIYDDDPQGLNHYNLFRRYLKTCSEMNVTISPKKFEVFCTSADIAGHLHGGGGLCPSPPRYQNIIDQPTPTTVGEVYKGMSPVGWSWSFIPNFAVLEQPIRAFVMKALKGGTLSMYRFNVRLLKDHGWCDRLQKCYDRMRLAAISSVMRAYRDPKKIPILLWDVSKFARSYTIVQVDPA